MCGGGWCLSGAGFLFCFSVSVACCRLGGGCGCCLFLLGLSLAFRSFNRQWRSFPRPSVSLVPFVVTRSAWFLTGRVLFSLTCSQGVCLSASPTVFPLIKRRSDANSILFVIRSGSFVPSYLNSFSSTANHTVVSLFLLPLACRTHQPPLHFPTSRCCSLVLRL